MRPTRRFVPSLMLSLLALGLVAMPAHATLLIRSDGNGLLVRDKNSRDDSVVIKSNASISYSIQNLSAFDFFKFDDEGSPFCTTSNPATCSRFAPRVGVGLLAGDDLLFMGDLTASQTDVEAGSGDDLVGAAPGKDRLVGDTGRDKLFAGGGPDDVFGGDDADELVGGFDADLIEGGAGNDAIYGGVDPTDSQKGQPRDGADIIRASSGNDFVSSKETAGSGITDDVSCGSGQDFLEADLKDVVPASCEEFEQSPVGETPHVRISRRGSLRVRSDGRVRVRLRCPRGVGSLGCKGRLSLRLDRRGARRARKRYRIRKGRSKTVTLELSGGSVRTLRRHPRTRGDLVSVEKGRKGRKTTARNPRLRLR